MRPGTLRNLVVLLLPVLAIASVLVAANLWAWRHLGRLDLTTGGVYSIGADSHKVLAGIDEPVRVTWFYDLRNKSMTDALALLEQYAQVNPNISVRGIDPAVHPAEARRYGIQFAGSAVFETAQRTLTIHGGTETDFTNALIRIGSRAHQSVCFTQGHREANPFSLKQLDDLEEHDGEENLVARVEVHERHGMGMARDALETLGFQVRRVLTMQGAEALTGCDVLVVAGPKLGLHPDEAEAVRAYVAGGGKALLMLEPGIDHGLDALLDDFGVVHDRRELLDPGHHYKSDPSSPAVSDYTRHRITRHLALTFYPGASFFVPAERGLPEDVQVTPLALTSNQAHPRGAREERGSLTLMLLATRVIGRAGETAAVAEGQAAGQAADEAILRPTLLVVGDADFATNTHYPLLGNGALFTGAVSYLAQREQLIDIRPRHYEGDRVQLTNRQMRLTFFITSVLLPLLALGTGLLLWWRRR
ncbi:MAG: GldG family protein [Burkholderiaceae bacterium]